MQIATRSGAVALLAKARSNEPSRVGQQLHDKTSPPARHPKMGRTGRPDLPNRVRELVAHRNYVVIYRVLHGYAPWRFYE